VETKALVNAMPLWGHGKDETIVNEARRGLLLTSLVNSSSPF